jgi:murein L,D-transpeptidase YcbB/YkuD
MNQPSRFLLGFLSFVVACSGSEKVEVRPPPEPTLPRPKAADAPVFIPPERPELQEIEAVYAELGPAAYPLEELDEHVQSVKPVSVRAAVQRIYEEHQGAYLWSDGLFLTAAGHRLLQLVSQCDNHGVRSQNIRAGFSKRVKAALDWNLKRLKSLKPNDSQRARTIRVREMLIEQVDVQLTASAFAFARQLDLTSLSGESLAKVIPAFEEREEWIQSMTPWHPQYWRLTRAMTRYRRYERKGAFVKVPASRELLRIQVGVRSADVVKLRERLESEGFLKRRSWVEQELFAAPIERALKAFQYSRGLPTSGRFTEKTARSMNVPVSRLIHRIRHSLRRWRRSQTRKEDTFIQVNLPEYVVELYEDRVRTRRHKAVIGYAFGTGGGRTKQFHSEVAEIQLNPSWMPSDGILENELLPREQRQPGYLARKGFKWTTRANGKKAMFQSPGPQNSLGRALLRFPNENNIYLHGSPDQDQFGQAYRANSHGCVRVENIEELVVHLLASSEGMEAEALWERFKTKQPHTIRLAHAIPIHFEYVTVVVDDSKFVRFLPNVYKR